MPVGLFGFVDYLVVGVFEAVVILFIKYEGFLDSFEIFINFETKSDDLMGAGVLVHDVVSQLVARMGMMVLNHLSWGLVFLPWPSR